ncbi:hypothetical protein PTKIN_Ptkin19aG0013700 [Pterospermum kingtungense]
MTRLNLVFLIVLFALIFQPRTSEARKLLNNLAKKQVEDNFIGSKLPKVSSAEGHAMANNERLFPIHLAKLDRLLQSTPSPGAGHH